MHGSTGHRKPALAMVTASFILCTAATRRWLEPLQRILRLFDGVSQFFTTLAEVLDERFLRDVVLLVLGVITEEFEEVVHLRTDHERNPLSLHGFTSGRRRFGLSMYLWH